MYPIRSFVEKYINTTLPSIGVKDVIEILILAFIIYCMMIWIRETRAWTLFKGIIVVLGVIAIAAILQMNTILWVSERLINVGLIALAVIFQPELRKALERLGRKKYMFNLFPSDTSKPNRRMSDSTVNELVKASFEMGAVKTGALIVLEKYSSLAEFEDTGIMVDAKLTSQLLINIFEKNTPLHDGAVIVRGDRVTAATCYLPLSDNVDIDKELDTRHRAAVGISEATDSLTIVVSEETGAVSITEGGRITRRLTEEGLRKRLDEFSYIGGRAENSAISILKGRLKNAKKDSEAHNS